MGRLCAHPDQVLEEHAALRWLITTATREAWKQLRWLTAREATVPFQVDSDLEGPAAEDTDPCELAIAYAEHQERVTRRRAPTGSGWRPSSPRVLPPMVSATGDRAT
jgi:hypothetical protein